MKIKTITCHDVYNVGASLQAYALAKYLQNLGHDVEIIDYKPDYLSNHYPLFGVNNSKFDKPFVREAYQIAKLPRRIRTRFSKRKNEFDKFTKQYLPLTQQRYTSNAELKENLPIADVYFAGSDQIWNTLFSNGKDPAFYLDFAPVQSIKASYAASFATEKIVSEYDKQVTEWIERLDFISVRESSGVRIINNMGISKVVQVLDPVFLLDKEAWDNISKPLKLKEPYVLLYDFDHNLEISSLVKQIARKHGWKIYSILSSKIADKVFNQEGPCSFISLIKNAQMVISNSFHATAFSLIYEKNFWVFMRKEKINNRMTDLLKNMEITDRLLLDDFKSINLDENVNYSLVRKKRKMAINFSKQYVAEVIKESI